MPLHFTTGSNSSKKQLLKDALLASGLAEARVAGWLGHATPGTTECCFIKPGGVLVASFLTAWMLEDTSSCFIKPGEVLVTSFLTAWMSEDATSSCFEPGEVLATSFWTA